MPTESVITSVFPSNKEGFDSAGSEILSVLFHMFCFTLVTMLKRHFVVEMQLHFSITLDYCRVLSKSGV